MFVSAPFVFDLVQFLLVIAASISNIQFYNRNYDIILRIAPKGLHVKYGIAFSGLLLSLVHFICGIYDIVFFMKRVEFMKDVDKEDSEEVLMDPF
ncbi:uncharacterized protein NPIL_562911 [Nephila pilipes]|uniref:Uncharacterized protein n=1 Tax=Nephila pilipes TaxID=299642 RepID=A0A8X6QVG7_NEPPI|nr:uncharacterized protein NPIL_562911 [Nephila pilipes]